MACARQARVDGFWSGRLKTQAVTNKLFLGGLARFLSSTPFECGVPLVKPNRREEGTLTIKGLLRNLPKP